MKKLKHINSNEDFIIATGLLCKIERLSLGLKVALERIICVNHKAKYEVNANNAKHMLFSMSKKTPPEPLPSTKDVYFDRVNYQCRPWKMALNLRHELSDPTDHGWVNDNNGSLGIHWKQCKPVPEVILEFVTCSCRKSECRTNQCGCVSVNLPCIDLCLCKSCKNSNKDTNIDTEDIFDDNVYDNYDEYRENGYNSDEEENGDKLFLGNEDKSRQEKYVLKNCSY